MQPLHVEVLLHTDIQNAWKHWNDPSSIKEWAFASDDWECLHAENDLRTGGRFLTRMSAKDGSVSFDFSGTYTEIIQYQKIKYLMDKENEQESQRVCEVLFTDLGGNTTKIEELFSPEEVNSLEMQKAGWTSILENFKKFVEHP
jgi:uncharacterized protein YndB with AHSA1/START domain